MRDRPRCRPVRPVSSGWKSGQPGTGAPRGAVAAAQAALAGGASLGYTEAFGRPSLRARIAAHGQDWYGHAADPARIAVTMGASAAFPLVFLAAFDPGDRVAMAAPYYPPYRNIVAALGLVPVVIETGVETRYQPTIAALETVGPAPGRVDRRLSLQPGRHYAAPGRIGPPSPPGATPTACG